MRALGLALVALVVVSMSACKKDDPADHPKEGSAKDPADKKEPTPPPGKPVGVLAADNDPAVVAAAKLALSDCGSTWDPEQGLDDSCEAVVKFREQRLEPRGKADATLINFYEDPAEKKWAQQWAKDENLADTVKEINEAE